MTEDKGLERVLMVSHSGFEGTFAGAAPVTPGSTLDIPSQTPWLGVGLLLYDRL